VVLPASGEKLRCRHCHLTLTADEVPGGYCPECFEEHGKKRFDFEKITDCGQTKTRYRCEACGAIIESD
jgi:methionyl-tRNA synthetase